jgi:DNA polymerase III alpha subunit (gram-positive type)
MKKPAGRCKYVCGNCHSGQRRVRVDSFRGNGFALHHIACEECGQPQIGHRTIGERKP